MMIRRLSRIGLRAAATAAAMALAACGAQPYPTPVDEAPPAPPPSTALLGEPESPPPYSPPLAPEYGPPVAEAPPPAAAPAYDGLPQAYYTAPPDAAPPVIIAMAPIPNPPEHERPARRAHTRLHRQVVVEEPAPREYHQRRHAATAAPHAPAPAVRPHAAVPTPSAPVKPAPVKPAPKAPAHAPAVVKPPVRPVPAPAPKATAPSQLKPAPTLKGPVAPAAPSAAAVPSTPLGDRATRIATLESTLAEVVRRDARLAAPARFSPDKPADVTLTIPAAFAQALRDEATKNGLAADAASVNLTAMLAGEGFVVSPDAAQAQPLTAGQPVVFHWTVTAQPNARGTLHADVGADLMGAGSEMLNLGSVQARSGAGLVFSPRMVGAAILVLIAALVAIWLARGGSGVSNSPAARREARRVRRSVRNGDRRPI